MVCPPLVVGKVGTAVAKSARVAVGTAVGDGVAVGVGMAVLSGKGEGKGARVGKVVAVGNTAVASGEGNGESVTEHPSNNTSTLKTTTFFVII
jgi:hypothetical protein